ncbi:hypothetical protein BJI49_06625 [Acetobacter pasteurianus]|uniref:Uncharacterized protein n=1 Tax=Acetobacter pasteurianus TaxID=438 RepID=A0A1A0DFN5_ACEPA|nr:hypothetical protein [Acetobacter pasteurianus]OAZ73919.1 hypothetical protein SRCM100623_00748 [Acetobacter pasteurianus]RCL07478.1 hypothetical protein BJI49_06625 [Acetobacter pasteurianus]GCD48770.1 hypothetical protein NBRC106471_0326 [Acetobacter pasteurianus subsp. pasteurianus LMG 1262 = NBRC 106471]
MSGTTTSSGTPISSLPQANAVSATDTLVGVVTSSGTTQAEQVPISVLAQGISETIGLSDAVSSAQTAAATAAAQAEQATENAANGVNAARGKANGVAALDASGNLALTDGTALQSALAVTPATQTQPATLKPLLTLDESSKVRTLSGDIALSEMATAMQDDDYLTVLGAAVVARPSVTGTIPADFTVNGNVYVAPASYISNPSSLPAGLSVDADTGIVLTDGSVFFPNTINNVGVLCAVSE